MQSHQSSGPVFTSASNSPYFDAVTVPENPYFPPPCSNHMNSNQINLENKSLAILINQTMLDILERMSIPLQVGESTKHIDEVSKQDAERLPIQTPPNNREGDNTVSLAEESQIGVSGNEINSKNSELLNYFFGNAVNNSRAQLRDITNSTNIPMARESENHPDEVNSTNTTLQGQLFLDVDIANPLLKTEDSRRQNKWEKHQSNAALLNATGIGLVENQTSQKNKQNCIIS